MGHGGWQCCFYVTMIVIASMQRVSCQIRKIAGCACAGKFPATAGFFSDYDMHDGTCVTHVPWCMPGSLTRGFLEVGCGENIPGIPDACATHNLTCLARGPWHSAWMCISKSQNPRMVYEYSLGKLYHQPIQWFAPKLNASPKEINKSTIWVCGWV